jgi:hypothetical protein
MKTKKQVDHEQVFWKLLKLRPSQTPTSILINFEIAITNALTIALPNATILGCLFHHGQSLWRRIQNEGLGNLYRDDEDIKLYSKMLTVLRLAPPEDVGAAFDAPNDSRLDNLENAYNYWKDNYVGCL